MHLFSCLLGWQPLLSVASTCTFHCPSQTAKTKYQKFETNTPRKGIARPQSQFPHSCVCERFIYSHDRSAYSTAGKYVDGSWNINSINRSQTHECGNWDETAQFIFWADINGIFVAVHMILILPCSLPHNSYLALFPPT